ncbi:NAD(P)/FAD-dependent oxidoreductase [Hoyosella subflava]|uniref:FAD-dependent pyridine nucleotide-disulfide oxidoreductase n=1 Tax=Hoyosella subflava (strain DSM 45089 / JCM 17490 / NBRC 109087 / DQS3-9A1) TaxID=443218 RepID=F6EFJ5_HOYSD|nr:FAD/NAD(P)-binding oxidoreductase [Hoyosella subflava]AEF40924.1 FAD-dependent pyridine nucleotide-disulfide oxidoreductase [Hoyosella subflava DQS3-9A1]
MAHALVLGGGFGGIAAAHELRRRLPAADEVTLIAASDTFFVGFAKLWELGGIRPLADGTRRLAELDSHGIRFVQAEVTSLDAGSRTAETSVGTFTADGLIVALGASFPPKHRRFFDVGVHNLYSANSLPAIKAALEEMRSGTIVVSILGAPYLCPPAPFEAALIVDEWLRERGRRDDIEVVVTTPQPITLPVAGPDASHFLAEQLGARNVTVLTEHKVDDVDADGTIIFSNGRTVRSDLTLGVPAASPPGVVSQSSLAGASGYAEPDRETFVTNADRVYAVGDCTMVPTATAQLPKAGVFAEAEGKVAAANLAADLHGGERARFDGHGYCYLELPGRKVARVQGNFYAEPRPDVELSAPDDASFAAKQQWESDRLTQWFG